MKRSKKSVFALVLALSIILSLSACMGTGEADITKLVQGNIDVIYQGKYDSEYLELVSSTQEEAERDYLDGLAVEAEYFAYYWGIVDPDYGDEYEDLDESFREELVELYREIYSYSKYEVMDAVKLEDGSYSVKVLVEPIDVMHQAYELYQNDAYEPLNEFWNKYADADFNTFTNEQYMDYTHEYGRVIVQMVRDQIPTLGYTEQKSQAIQGERSEEGKLRINDDDWAIFDSYVIDYP